MNRCEICGQPCGIYEICRECEIDLKDGKVSQCKKCGKYFLKDHICNENETNNTTMDPMKIKCPKCNRYYYGWQNHRCQYAYFDEIGQKNKTHNNSDNNSNNAKENENNNIIQCPTCHERYYIWQTHNCPNKNKKTVPNQSTANTNERQNFEKKNSFKEGFEKTMGTGCGCTTFGILAIVVSLAIIAVIIISTLEGTGII